MRRGRLYTLNEFFKTEVKRTHPCRHRKGLRHLAGATDFAVSCRCKTAAALHLSLGPGGDVGRPK